MDQYGTFRNTDEDLLELKSAMQDNGNVCFAWSHNQIDAYVILITNDFTKLGVLPFGGNPDGRAWVSLYGKTSGHFSQKDTHANYFAEKLDLDQETSEAFAWMWTRLWENWS